MIRVHAVHELLHALQARGRRLRVRVQGQRQVVVVRGVRELVRARVDVRELGVVGVAVERLERRLEQPDRRRVVAVRLVQVRQGQRRVAAGAVQLQGLGEGPLRLVGALRRRRQHLADERDGRRVVGQRRDGLLRGAEGLLVLARAEVGRHEALVRGQVLGVVVGLEVGDDGVLGLAQLQQELAPQLEGQHVPRVEGDGLLHELERLRAVAGRLGI
mmetsp:Transcript_11063/g.33022  ORF Transcript_11063/g.33022 Transcript_11063/m.33022 type:complete len:216 (-) Transcript_11063:679-1326(-)